MQSVARDEKTNLSTATIPVVISSEFVVAMENTISKGLPMVVFYERGESRKNFSPAGEQEVFLRPPALNLPVSHATWLSV